MYFKINMRVLVTIEMGFTLISIPLLTLSTDVLHKFQPADQRYGQVNIFHLDKLYDTARLKYKSIIVYKLLKGEVAGHFDNLMSS